ncbi:MAG TPA: cyanophycin synthetase, partial [Bacillota bacterium]|nr:cyanophycin synthetase [Bacillota bacterium]
PVILFALNDDNLALLRHLTSGGTGITVRGGFLYWVCGSRWQRLISVRNIPLAERGLALHQLQNVLAAAAAALAMKVPRNVVARGVATFVSSPEQNPGRLNLYDLKGDRRLLLDYGHNPAAMKATLHYARRLGCRRLLGVIGVPGDRNDDLIRQCGQTCAPFLDRIIIKEDCDLRGRAPGETARLLREGCINGGSRPGQIDTVLNELEAVAYGLSLLEEGDLLVVFYEHREPIAELLQSELKTGDGRPDLAGTATVENGSIRCSAGTGVAK